MLQFSARPMRIVDSTATRLTTGMDPGRPRHTGQTWVLASAPKAVGQEQNIFEFGAELDVRLEPEHGLEDGEGVREVDGVVAAWS